MKRRNFLQATAGLSVAALTTQLAKPLYAMPQSSKYLDSIGLQLWTVRNQLKDDTSKTLKAVADAGYKQVELMSVTGSEEIVEQAKDLGMGVTSGFMNWESICKPEKDGIASVEDIIETASKMGLQHLVFGYIGQGSRETPEQMKQIAKNTNEAAKKAADAGLQMCYHNHSFEFKKIDGDTTGYDILVEEFDKELVKFELDVFWVKVGGLDPLEMMKKLDGRISQVHLKDVQEATPVIYDEGKVPEEAFKECGNGTIDMGEVMKLAEEVGAVNCHVEQDQSPDPIVSIGESIDYLNGLS